jgi:hypothetical protein
MSLNTFATKVLDYLTTDGHHPQRKQALQDLIGIGALGYTYSDRTQEAVETYLKANKRGFCQEGINRFRTAVGLKPTTKKVRIVLDLELENTKTDFGSYDSRDNRFVMDFTRNLAGHQVPGREEKVVSAEFHSYTTTPNGTPVSVR